MSLDQQCNCQQCLDRREAPQLRAENARLRSELEKIADWGDPLDYLQTIARAALASAHPGDREQSNPTPERP